MELLEERRMLTGDWHNSTLPEDVDSSAGVTPRDALHIITELNQRLVSDLAGKLPDSNDSGRLFLDVTGDGNVTPRDALQVIQYINDPPEHEVANVDLDTAFDVHASHAGEESTDVASSIIGAMLTLPLVTRSQMLVNAVTRDDQEFASVAIHNSGYVIVWASDDQDGSDWAIMGQRFDPGGQKVGSEFRVNGHTRSAQRYPSVSAATDGRFVVSWQSLNQDGSGWGVFARLFNADGTPLSNDIRVNQTTSGTQQKPALTLLADGGFAIAWEGKGKTDASREDSYGVFVRKFNANGTPATSELRVNNQGRHHQEDPDVAALPNGGYVVVWAGDGAAGNDEIYVRAFDGDGNFSGHEQNVNVYRRGKQWQPSVATSAAGEITVAWTSGGNHDKSGWGVFARRFNSVGLATGNEFQVHQKNTGTQWNPDVVYLNDGGFLIAWAGLGFEDKDGIHARRFNADGTPFAGQFEIPSFIKGKQRNPVLASASTGYVAAWNGRGEGDYEGVYANSVALVAPNQAPDVSVTDITIDEEAPWAFTLDASDPDGDNISIEWRFLPEGIVDHGAGELSWTPTEGQGPGEFTLTAMVTDDNMNFAITEQSFIINVAEVNRPPVIDPIGDSELDASGSFSFVARATDLDQPTNTLRFNLDVAPTGAQLNSVTGEINWTPQPGQTQAEFTISVVDNGTPPLSDSESFLITVSRPFEVLDVAPIVEDEEVPIVFVATTAGGDGPVAFTLGEDSPSDATIDSATGEFAWTPTERDGPDTFTVTIIAADSGTPTRQSSVQVPITVNEVNQPPELSPIDDQQINAEDGLAVEVTSSDPDFPEQAQTYSIVSGPPGAVIDENTGELAWAAPSLNESQEFQFVIRVDDNFESDSKFDEEEFIVTVASPNCIFNDELDGWQAKESGGLQSPGSVVAQNCAAILSEGDSFLVELSTPFTVAEESAVRFTYSGLVFDDTDTEFHNDAFEFALLDLDGNPLVATFDPSRDAAFNITEGLEPAFDSSISVEDRTVTIGLNGIPAGTQALAVFRLVNNDSDKQTSITIDEFRFVESELLPSVRNNVAVANLAVPIRNRSPTRPASEPISVRSDGPEISDNESSFGLDGTFSPTIEWSVSQFSERPESNQVMMTPVVGDLDLDGVPDIVFSTFSGGVYQHSGVLRAINGDGSGDVWSITSASLEVSPTDSPALADIDHDGYMEIVAPHEDGSLIAFEHDGSLKWQSEIIWPGETGTPAIADIDGDGQPEIVYGASVMDRLGNLVWKAPTAHSYASTVADLDQDGMAEILSGDAVYRSSGELWWSPALDVLWSAVGNFDNDTHPEVVFVGRGKVHLFEHDGTPIWQVDLPDGGYGGPPAIADFDGDNKPEIGVGGQALYSVVQSDGPASDVITTAAQDISSASTGSTVFDFDGNGSAEVVYADEVELRILDGSTLETLYTFNKGSGTGNEYSPVVDVDGDGSSEIVIPANDYKFGEKTGIFVLGEDSWVPTRQIWNQFSYHISNIDDDGSIPAIEVPGWEVHNSYLQNLQPTGVELGQPSISVSAPSNSGTIGDTILLSGQAFSDGQRSDGSPNEIEYVTVNDVPVDVMDAGGRFFTQVEIQPGQNTFHFDAVDSVGQRAPCRWLLVAPRRRLNSTCRAIQM